VGVGLPDDAPIHILACSTGHAIEMFGLLEDTGLGAKTRGEIY